MMFIVNNGSTANATTVNIVNSILRTDGAEIMKLRAVTAGALLNVTISYSAIDTSKINVDDHTYGTLTHTTGIVSTDPAFVDAANGDYTLLSTSPCVGTGLVQSVNLAKDTLGEPLPILAGSVDIGAYQSTHSPWHSVNL
jgi:hypothetical protein